MSDIILKKGIDYIIMLHSSRFNTVLSCFLHKPSVDSISTVLYRSVRFALTYPIGGVAYFCHFAHLLSACNSRKRVKPQSFGKKKISLHLIPFGCFKTNVLSDLCTCPISLRNQDRISTNGKWLHSKSFALKSLCTREGE